jgi:hypothetical protein
MKKPLVYILSAALAATGCSKGVNDTTRHTREYSPLVPNGSIAICVRDAAAMRSSPMFDFMKQWAKEQQKAVPGNIDDNAPAAVKKFAETIGGAQYSDVLERACAREKWSIVTIGQLPFTMESLDGEDTKVAIPAIAVVEATCEPTTTEESFAFFKTVAAPYRTLLHELFSEDDDNAAEKAELLAKVKDAFDVTTDTVAGCEVRRLTIKRNNETAEILDHVSGLEPCFGVFDGALEILASSPQVFANIVALYSGNAAAAPADSAIARDAALKDGSHILLGLYGISKAIAAFAGDKLDEAPEDAARYLKSIGDFRMTGRYDSTSVVFGLGLSFDDDTLPQLLAGICNGGIGMAKGAISMSALKISELTPVATLVNDMNVVADGRDCKLAITITKDFLEKLDVAAIGKKIEAMKQGQGDDDNLFGGNEGDGKNGDVDDAEGDK